VADLPSLTPAQLAVLRRVPSAPEVLFTASQRRRRDLITLLGMRLVRVDQSYRSPAWVRVEVWQRTPLGDAVVARAVDEPGD